MFNLIEPSVLTFAKYGILSFLLIYMIFAGAVVKQVKTMTDTLEVGFERQIIILSYLHLFISLLVFAFAFFVL